MNNGLLDREVWLVGQIIVQWGALEYEIFTHTALTFDDGTDEALPVHEMARRKEFRDALVHGMWRWSADELTRIRTGKQAAAVLRKCGRQLLHQRQAHWRHE